MRLWIAVLGILSLAFRQEATGTSGIKKVVVYPDRALVTREAKHAAPAGVSRFEFKDLPAGIETDSVRARVLGTDKVQLRGIEVKTYPIEKLLGDKLRELGDQRDRLREQIVAVQDRLAALASRKEFIISLKAAVAHDGSMGVIREKPRIEDWKNTATFVEESLVEISRKFREAEKEKGDLESKHHVVCAELAKLTNRGALTKNKVVATLEAQDAGAITLELSYLIVGAGWVPFYDIHAEVEKGEARILYYGQIVQGTGEDWSGVELALSTAHPARSARMPDMAPLVVGSHASKALQQGMGVNPYGNPLQKRVEDLNKIIRSQNDNLYNIKGLQENSQDFVNPPPLPGFQPQTSSHVFRIKSRESIPSDESPHKVTIATTTFKGAFDRISTPKLSSHLYLKTQIHNENEFPYMPGEMNIFLNNDFIGCTGIEMVAPGERFEAYLGVDEGIKVTRRLESKRIEAGTLQKAHYTFVIRVENFKSKKTRVSILDQIPVSRDSDIEVILEADTTPPASRDKDGKLTWNIEIEGGKTAEIRLGYRVYFPANKPVALLE